jgi:hypothetical protein
MKAFKILFFVAMALLIGFTACEKKDPPMVENGFYFDYKKYNAARYGGCVAGGIVNYTWDVNLVNIPEEGNANVSSKYFNGECDECCGLQVTNNPLTERYIAVSGTVWREGSLVAFDVECRKEGELSNGRDYRLKGSYYCDQDQ